MSHIPHQVNIVQSKPRAALPSPWFAASAGVPCLAGFARHGRGHNETWGGIETWATTRPSCLRADPLVLHQLRITLVEQFFNVERGHERLPHFVDSFVDAGSVEMKVGLQLSNNAQEH